VRLKLSVDHYLGLLHVVKSGRKHPWVVGMLIWKSLVVSLQVTLSLGTFGAILLLLISRRSVAGSTVVVI
jgi:hypothetical protein